MKLTADSLPSTVNVKIDATVLTFTLVISIVTGLLFWYPACSAHREVNFTDALKLEGGRTSLLRNTQKPARAVCWWCRTARSRCSC